MRLYTCQPCQDGNHTDCHGTFTAPSGAFGGSKCICGCEKPRHERKRENESCRKRLIRMMDERKEFAQDVDGFVYYWPEGSPNGHLSEHHLRWIADELKERNREWQTIVDTMPHNAKLTRLSGPLDGYPPPQNKEKTDGHASND